MDSVSDPHPNAATLGGLGGALLDEAALDGLLQLVVQLARRAIPSARAVSITVAENGGYRTSTSTGPDALAVDEAQYATGDGPCLAGMREARQRRWTMAEVGERWPAVADRARELGLAGVLSTPLVVEAGSAIGALNVYAGDRVGFDDDHAAVARLLGQLAAVLVNSALALFGATRLNDQLSQAVATREIIGEAKGILMEREGCTRDDAFDMLRRASQRENRKLRDIAEELVLRVEARRGGSRREAPPAGRREL